MNNYSACRLTVFVDGKQVGSIVVGEQLPGKVLGKFAASPASSEFVAQLNVARELDRQFDATSPAEPVDYRLYDQLMSAYESITRLSPTLAEMPKQIAEFAIHHDWSVEITFGMPDYMIGAAD